jgi:poly(3-hydroxybutyrate) depolymerase
MSSEKNEKVPSSMTLMGGPIDTRENPTMVNNFALQKSLSWFSSHMVTRVPANHPGYMRAVYPGFLQIASFVMMNIDRHLESHMKLFKMIMDGDDEHAETQRKFYDEYFAAMDIPAEFYLQTVQTVFKDFSLPRGIMVSRGRPVDTKAVRKTALLGIEGELDDISGIGQTRAAITLCSNLSDSKKEYYMQPGAGHYGVFSGRKFRDHILPVIRKFVDKHDK